MASEPTQEPSSDASSLPEETLEFAARIFQAVRTGGDEMNEFLDAVLERGLPPNLRNEGGNSLLLLAAYHGNASTVQLLLKHKADPNILNDRGQSAIAGAVYKNEKEVVQILLDNGGDPMIGQPSAIDTADMFKNEEITALFKAKISSASDTTPPVAISE